MTNEVLYLQYSFSLVMSISLPSLNALRAFECAGRNLSFSRAAEELNVTPAAIGHQIRVLEERLEVQLFIRLNREVRLTQAGEALLPGLQDVFSRLTHVVTDFRYRSDDRILAVSVPVSFALKWLIPRLDRFKTLHPDIHIRIDSNDKLVNFDHDNIDVGIRYGCGSYPGLDVSALSDIIRLFPVCSPSLANKTRPLNGPEDLSQFTILNQPITSANSMWPDWQLWLKTLGYSDVKFKDEIQFNASSTAIQAAIQG
ncbi:MAG: LysR family transcriptional regulator [Gammaproteobacteria bacterium]|nr:LysR family transcriptional regulator [Gammaproteobacteria bacterium]